MASDLPSLSRALALAAGLISVALMSFVIPGPAAGQSSSPPAYNSRVISLVVAPESPPLTYALVALSQDWDQPAHPRYRLFRSKDRGETWDEVGLAGVGEVTEASCLAVDYRDPRVLYLAASSEPFPYGALSLFRSISGGQWEKMSGPIPGLSAVAVDMKDSNVLYGGASYGALGGFIRSEDGGHTWRPFDNAWPDPSAQLPSEVWRAPVRRILVDPVDPNVLYASLVWSYRYREGRLFRGDRQGNWVEIAAPAPAGGVLSLEGIAFDPQTRSLYLGSGPWGGAGTVLPSARKLWRSENPFAADPKSVEWNEVTSFDLGRWGWQASLPSVDPLAVDAGVRPLVYVETSGADSALWKSADSGTSWLAAPIPSEPFSAPGTSQSLSWYSGDTRHTVSGEWLQFLKNHGDTDNLGYPRSEVIADPMAGGQTVQYFQRLILEWHPENPPEYRIQRRLLGDILHPGADPPLDPGDATTQPAGEFLYFANLPGIGLGHYVANFSPSGEFTGFLEYFDSHGGVEAFGYPKEEPKLRNGRWTQRFQAAVFEYHPENDVDGTVPGTDIPFRNYRVQLELLGDRYIEANRLTYR